MQFKPGDRLKRKTRYLYTNGWGNDTRTYTIKYILDSQMELNERSGKKWDPSYFDLVEPASNQSFNPNNMGLLDKFALLLKNEPQKSFRKAGITNGDDILTSEGQTLFLTWLLGKHEGEFLKDVVSPILEEDEKK